MVDTQRQRMLSTSMGNYVSVDPDTSWAAQSLQPSFSFLRERARFQQKQLQEKEAKLLRLYEEQQERQERALQRVKGPWNPPAVPAPADASTGAGKVRSLLQYRRDHGRDKSYPLEPLQNRSPPKPTRTHSLEPKRGPHQPKLRQNVLYFGGSQHDLRFSDERDYGQSFQVVNDQLLYDAPPSFGEEYEDFHIQSFNNKRQFYENHLAGLSEENLSDYYQQTPFQRLPNVGKMSQPAEPPGKYKTYVSGKATIGGTPPRSGLPTRLNGTSAAAKKPSNHPPPRPRLGLDSPPARSPPESKTRSAIISPTSKLSNGGSDKNVNGTRTPPRLNGLNGAGSPPPRAINGNVLKKPLTTSQRTSKTDQVAPPVPASRTTVPRSASSTPSSASSEASRAKPSPKSSTSSTPAGLVSCRYCERNFASDRIEKHEPICRKTMSKKPKVYDPVKARVEGTEAAKYVLTGISEKNAKKAEKVVAAKSNWRRKHEEFINSIRAAKEVKEHLRKGGKLSDLPPPPPSDYSDYVQCPHCQRKFNESAAERHIPKCATMLHNKPQPVKRPTAPVRSSSTFRKK